MKEWTSIGIAVVQLLWVIGAAMISRSWNNLDARLRKIEDSVEASRRIGSDKSSEQNKVIGTLQVDVRVVEAKLEQSRDDRGLLREDIRQLREELDRRTGDDRRKK